MFHKGDRGGSNRKTLHRNTGNTRPRPMTSQPNTLFGQSGRAVVGNIIFRVMNCVNISRKSSNVEMRLFRWDACLMLVYRMVRLVVVLLELFSIDSSKCFIWYFFGRMLTFVRQTVPAGSAKIGSKSATETQDWSKISHNNKPEVGRI